MLTCSAVSPLLGPSSPSDSVSLTTPRAASSPASLPSRREQCRREQLAAEPTPLREGGRQHHGLLLLLLPSSRPHRGRIQQCQQPAPTAALLQGCCEQPNCSGCRAVPAQGKKGAGTQHGGEESPQPARATLPRRAQVFVLLSRPCSVQGSRQQAERETLPLATSPLQPSSVLQPSPAGPAPASAEGSRANTVTAGREHHRDANWMGPLGPAHSSPWHTALPCAPQGKRRPGQQVPALLEAPADVAGRGRAAAACHQPPQPLPALHSPPSPSPGRSLRRTEPWPGLSGPFWLLRRPHCCRCPSAPPRPSPLSPSSSPSPPSPAPAADGSLPPAPSSSSLPAPAAAPRPVSSTR